jgi:poly-D-alanine transfer protein DltD
MYVPSYQMHNVLNVYSKQLKQNVSSGNNNPAARMLTDRVNLTPEEKRQATIEKVSKDILSKITRFGSLAETRQRITAENEMIPPNNSPADEKQETTFVFNAIDSINQKITNTLSVEDSGFLIQKLEQLAKESGNKKTGSWV